MIQLAFFILFVTACVFAAVSEPAYVQILFCLTAIVSALAAWCHHISNQKKR